MGYGYLLREHIGWVRNSVYLTPKAGLGGGGDWLRENDQEKKRENLKGWGKGEIALIKNSQDTFPSHGR